MSNDTLELVSKIFLFMVPFLFALSFHEFAHGWVANKLGDNTADLMGRLTLNPFAHADLVGTFVLPLMAVVTGWPLFGWAKPVPVNERNLKNPKSDMFWIALAGPLSNILLLAIAAVVIYLLGGGILSLSRENMKAAYAFLGFFMLINGILAVFNMIPLHPLDGGKVLARFLPESWNRALEENQGPLNIALIIAVVAGGVSFLAIPVFYAISATAYVSGVDMCDLLPSMLKHCP